MLKVSSNKVIVETKKNITRTWQELYKVARVQDRNQPLTKKILSDPTHPVVRVVIWTYTYEGFVYKVLNKACRVKDSSKITTLGAYSLALSIILGRAGKNRVDINPSEYSKCELFRGSGLTE